MINFYDEPVGGLGLVTIGEWRDYLIQVMPMIYNDRLVMTPKSRPYIYDWGWCFPKGSAAILAAAVWDPATQDEPAGYIKAVITGRRAPTA